MSFFGNSVGSVVLTVFRPYKSRCVTISVMAGEVVAVSDFFDAASTLTSKLELLLGSKFPLQLMPDSKSLFDFLLKTSQTSKRRLMTYIAAARRVYE